jgi:hypothetical protein
MPTRRDQDRDRFDPKLIGLRFGGTAVRLLPLLRSLPQLVPEPLFALKCFSNSSLRYAYIKFFLPFNPAGHAGTPSPGEQRTPATAHEDEGGLDWQRASLPIYMQQGNIVGFCRGWEEGVLRADAEDAAGEGNVVWEVMR